LDATGERVDHLVEKSEDLKHTSTRFRKIIKRKMPTPPRPASRRVKFSLVFSLAAREEAVNKKNAGVVGSLGFITVAYLRVLGAHVGVRRIVRAGEVAKSN